MSVVRMRVRISGTRDGVEWPEVGGLVTLPDAEAADMVAAGLAEPAAAAAPETAAAPAEPETAAAPAPRKRAPRAPKS